MKNKMHKYRVYGLDYYTNVDFEAKDDLHAVCLATQICLRENTEVRLIYNFDDSAKGICIYDYA